MNYSKRLKQRISWLFYGLCFGITPYMFHFADLERGYDATGGEIFIPLLPFVVQLIKKVNV